MATMTTGSERRPFHTKEDASSVSWRMLRDEEYFVGRTRVRCWICACSGVAGVTDEDRRVILYGEGVGLMEIKPPTPELAEEIFALLTKYGLSLYHVEDVLEDRGIPASIRMI